MQWSFCIFSLLLYSEALEDKLFSCRWAYFVIFRVIWENIRETVMATSLQRTCTPHGEDESSWTSGAGQALADEGFCQVWLGLAEWALGCGTCSPPGQVPPTPDPRTHFPCLQKCRQHFCACRMISLSLSLTVSACLWLGAVAWPGSPEPNWQGRGAESRAVWISVWSSYPVPRENHLPEIQATPLFFIPERVCEWAVIHWPCWEEEQAVGQELWAPPPRTEHCCCGRYRLQHHQTRCFVKRVLRGGDAGVGAHVLTSCETSLLIFFFPF